MSLCADKLGITLDHVGDLPDVREISNHLLNVTRFFDLPAGAPYYAATQGIVDRIDGDSGPRRMQQTGTFDFTDEEREEIIRFIDTLDERVFSQTRKNAWKLRMFFKPAEVVSYLVSRGVTHALFYKSA
jgi:flagellar biosynthesis protein FlhG